VALVTRTEEESVNPLHALIGLAVVVCVVWALVAAALAPEPRDVTRTGCWKDNGAHIDLSTPRCVDAFRGGSDDAR
jgi:hypothetical protein